MASSMQLASLLSNMRMPEGVSPVRVSLPPPPKLEGPLQPNNVLARAVKFADNMVTGPESMVLSNGYVYTGLSDGNVVEVKPSGTVRKIRRMSVNGCGRPNAGEGACGRPLGVREHRGWLIVADAYHGIIALNPSDGSFQILVDGRLRVNGKRIGGFINDLAVAKDGSIYFTSSSSKYTRKDYLNVILEGETSGRVLVYNPRFPGRLKVKELVTTLSFPNGLQLSKDETYLLIAESARARIHKAYIDRNSPKYGQIEMFAENLPGFVDNIRLSPRGTLWVGLSRVRHAGQPSVLDKYGNQPRIRGAIMGMPRNAILQQAPNYGIALEMDLKGQILRSLQDPTGEKYVAVSEVAEENGTLYIGSFDKKFIGKLKLSDLPPIYRPDGGGTGEVNQQLAAFLNQIRERMMTMGLNQVRDIVIALVQNLVQVKLDALRAQSRANALQLEVERLQAIVNSQVTTAGPPTEPPPTTTPSSADQGSTTPTGGQATTTAGGDQGTTSGGGDAGTTSGTTSSGDSAGTTQAPTTPASGDTTAAGTTSASGAGDTTAGATTAAGTTAEGTTASGTTAAGTTAEGSTESGTTAAGTTAAGTTAAGTTAADATAADTTAADSGSTDSTLPPP